MQNGVTLEKQLQLLYCKVTNPPSIFEEQESASFWEVKNHINPNYI